MVIALRSNYVHTSRPQEDGCEDPNAFSWEQLSRHVARWFKLAPGANCMLGPLDVQAKVGSQLLCSPAWPSFPTCVAC